MNRFPEPIERTELDLGHIIRNRGVYSFGLHQIQDLAKMVSEKVA